MILAKSIKLNLLVLLVHPQHLVVVLDVIALRLEGLKVTVQKLLVLLQWIDDLILTLEFLDLGPELIVLLLQVNDFVELLLRTEQNIIILLFGSVDLIPEVRVDL